MLKKNQGSALILVLVVMAFIMIAGVSLISVTQSEYIMAKSSNDYDSAYYIAEAGVQRAVSIIGPKINSIIDATIASLETDTIYSKITDSAGKTSYINDKVDRAIKEYLTENPDAPSSDFLNAINFYQRYSDPNNPDNNGKDTAWFMKSNNNISYYQVKANIFFKDESGVHNRYVAIDSTGINGKSRKQIKCDYFIGGSLVEEDNTDSDYTDMDIYSRNALTVVGGNTINTGAITANKGNVLLEGSNVDINGNITVDKGNLAIRGQNVSFQGNIQVYNGDIILDSINPVFNSTATVTPGKWYSPYPRTGIIRYDINKCKDFPWNPSGTGGFDAFPDMNILDAASSYNNIRSNFQLRTVKKFNDYRGVDVVFYNEPTTLPNDDDEKYNGTFFVIICNGDLNITEDVFKKGVFIYCTGKLTLPSGGFAIDGQIIAGSIETSGSLTINYDGPTGNGKYPGLIEKIKQNAISDNRVTYNNYNITCSAWDK